MGVGVLQLLMSLYYFTFHIVGFIPLSLIDIFDFD